MKRIVLISLLSIVLLGIALAVGALVYVDREAWITSRKLSAALRNARSVVLVEYSGDIEISRKTATSEEISRLRNAVSVWPRPFVAETALCFEPHHRIEIVRADGSEWKSAICFLCGRFAIEEEPFLAPLPPYLAKSLAPFFASIGMAPKTDDEYRTIEISARRQSKKADTQPQ